MWLLTMVAFFLKNQLCKIFLIFEMRTPWSDSGFTTMLTPELYLDSSRQFAAKSGPVAYVLHSVLSIY